MSEPRHQEWGQAAIEELVERVQRQNGAIDQVLEKIDNPPPDDGSDWARGYRAAMLAVYACVKEVE